MTYTKKFSLTKNSTAQNIGGKINSEIIIQQKTNDIIEKVEKNNDDIYIIPKKSSEFYVSLKINTPLTHYHDIVYEIYYSITPFFEDSIYDSNTFNTKTNDIKTITNYKPGDEYNFVFLGTSIVDSSMVKVKIEQ